VAGLLFVVLMLTIIGHLLVRWRARKE